MSGKKAKVIRKLVYGKDNSPKARKHYRMGGHGMPIVCDENRQRYQKLKAAHSDHRISL